MFLWICQFIIFILTKKGLIKTAMSLFVQKSPQFYKHSCFTFMWMVFFFPFFLKILFKHWIFLKNSWNYFPVGGSIEEFEGFLMIPQTQSWFIMGKKARSEFQAFHLVPPDSFSLDTKSKGYQVSNKCWGRNILLQGVGIMGSFPNSSPESQICLIK